MTALLEIRETIKKFYAKNAGFIIPVVRFFLAFLVLTMINSKMGYMSKLDHMSVVLMVSLLCAVLPGAVLAMFAGTFTLLHMYAMSLEAAGVGLCVYAILLLLLLRFDSKDIIVVVITPLLFFMKLPYVIPICVGLIGTPFMAVSMAGGIVVYYLLTNIIASAPTISTMGEDPIAKIRLIIDGLIENKTMLVVVVAFTITVLVVYAVRRMAIEHCWTIAMVAGVMVNLLVLLVGDLLYDTNMSVLSAIFGCLLALAVGKAIEFFRFCVDFGRMEKVQFEDDEYYYYVKAVPKMSVAESTRTVKKINSQKKPAPSREERAQGTVRHSAEGRRYVTTERTGRRRPADNPERQSSYNRNNGTKGSNSRSVTVSNEDRAWENPADEIDDFEELF